MKRYDARITYDDRYRTVGEAETVRLLLRTGYPYADAKADAEAAIRKRLDGWVADGLGARAAPGGARLFDPVEVLNFIKQAAIDGRDRFWAERYVASTRRLLNDLASASGSTLTLRLQRTFNLEGVPEGKSVRLRAPLPLRSVHGETIEIAPFADGGGETTLVASEGRLEARLTRRAGLDQVAVGAQIRLAVDTPTARGSDRPDLEPWLKPREGGIVVTSRVAELAMQLAPPGLPAEASVRAFWDFIARTVSFAAAHYDEVDAAAPCDWVLDSGWSDCQLGSALFIALCRARGIPARQVNGFLIYPKAPGFHYWAEVWLEDMGWTPFDFTSQDLDWDDGDRAWKDFFYGRLDRRLVIQRLPQEFTGALGLPIPPVWHILQMLDEDGTEIRLVDLDNRPVYADRISARLD